VHVERVVVWPDLACAGAPTVHGAPLPADPPPPQTAPKGGTDPRVTPRRAARLPYVLLGWVGADGFPMVVPVGVRDSDERGVRLRTPPDVVPPGGRRAGLTAHSFERYVVGHEQRIHTGWLEATDDGEAVYAAHTRRGYRLPRSKLIYAVASGVVTRRRHRDAERAGLTAAAAARSAGSGP
jgi:hypothetical protein